LAALIAFSTVWDGPIRKGRGAIINFV